MYLHQNLFLPAGAVSLGFSVLESRGVFGVKAKEKERYSISCKYSKSNSFIIYFETLDVTYVKFGYSISLI